MTSAMAYAYFPALRRSTEFVDESRLPLKFRFPQWILRHPEVWLLVLIFGAKAANLEVTGLSPIHHQVYGGVASFDLNKTSVHHVMAEGQRLIPAN